MLTVKMRANSYGVYRNTTASHYGVLVTAFLTKEEAVAYVEEMKYLTYEQLLTL
jgi:hypothetical protein